MIEYPNPHNPNLWPPLPRHIFVAVPPVALLVLVLVLVLSPPLPRLCRVAVALVFPAAPPPPPPPSPPLLLLLGAAERTGFLPPMGIRRAGGSDGAISARTPDGHCCRTCVHLLLPDFPRPVFEDDHLDPHVSVSLCAACVQQQRWWRARFPRRSKHYHSRLQFCYFLICGCVSSHSLYGTQPPGATPTARTTWTGAHQWGGGGQRLGS